MKSFSSLLVLFVGLAALYLPRRAKELSAHGKPLLRYYGPALVCLVSAVFWIGVAFRGLSRGESQWHPDDLYVDFIFFAISAVGAFWFLFGWRTVLTEHSVEHRMWPFPPLTYDLRDAVSVRRAGAFSIEFSKKRRFGVFPFASGHRYFIAALEAQLNAIGK